MFLGGVRGGVEQTSEEKDQTEQAIHGKDSGMSHQNGGARPEPGRTLQNMNW